MDLLQLTYPLLTTLRADSSPGGDNIVIIIASAVGAFLYGWFGRWWKDRQDRKKITEEATKEATKKAEEHTQSLVSPLNIKITELEETNNSLKEMLDESQSRSEKQEAFYKRELEKQEIRFNLRLERLEQECHADRVLSAERIALLEDRHTETVKELERVKAQYGTALALNEEYRTENERLKRRKGTSELAPLKEETSDAANS